MGAAITINGGYQVTLKNQNSTVAVYSDNGGNTIQGGDYNYNIDLQGLLTLTKVTITYI